MLGKKDLMEQYKRRAITEAERTNWYYLPELMPYLDSIEDKFATSTQVTLDILPIKTGFKLEQPFLINPANACHYCHDGQRIVPDRYLHK